VLSFKRCYQRVGRNRCPAGSAGLFYFWDPASPMAPIRGPALHPELVKDLNGPDRLANLCGVPAIFKQFTLEAGLTDYEVSSQLVGARAWNTGSPFPTSWRASTSRGTRW
jgi:hypothetical protein